MTRLPRPRAKVFAAALRQAMKRDRWTVERLAEKMHVSKGTVSGWRHGQLPDTQNVALLATVLDATYLVRMAREELTRTCAYCGVSFVQGDRTGLTIYCSKRHKSRAGNDAEREMRLARRPETFDDLKGRVLSLETELEYVRRDRDEAQAVIDAMCWACAPEGVCRDATSPLRERSPLPLADERVRVA
jgi:transcriptional regulator with XRE-family HTH domain